MDKQEQYYYEKNPFGRRHRRYFLEDRIGLDAPSIQTFTALRIKLYRDYLGFFRGLTLLHKEGETRKLSMDAVRITMELISILDFAIARNILDKDKIDKVVEKVNQLNTARDILVRTSQENELLQTKIEQVEEATGISPEDLGVTERRIRQGIRREIRERRPISRLERRMPRTHGYGRGVVGGLAAAALGPFYPMMRMGWGFLRDVFGAGGREREGRRFEREMIPSAYSATYGDIGRPIRGGRFGGLPAGYFPRRKTSDAFRDFFDREAYKTKWTKELLAEIKGIRKREKKDGGLFDLFGLGDKFKLLSAGILPFIGKVGLLAGLGVAIGWTIDKYYEFGKALANYSEAMKKAHKVYTEGLDTLESRAKMIREVGIEKVAEAVGTTPKEIAMRQVSLRRRMEFGEQLTRGNWWDLALSRMKRAYGLERPSLQKPFYEETEETLRRLGGKPVGAPQTYTIPAIISKLPVPKGFEAIGKAIESISKREVERRKIDEDVTNAIKLLTTELRRGRSSVKVKEPGLGDPYDSGDSLLKSHALGNLTIRE